jgi:hypothetical protein
LAFSWPSPLLQPPPLRAAGMEERRRLSKHRSYVAWRPKLPGQIEFGPTPTHTGPAAQEATTPVAQTRIAWPSSGTDMNRVAAAR